MSTNLQIRVEAFAKLNLRLKVTGRRPDGFHLLSMLNVQTALADKLQVTIEPGEGIGLGVTYEPYVAQRMDAAGRKNCEDPGKNLATRAAAMLVKKFGLEKKILIQLHKAIPTGAGLGGGSSDAAAVLNTLSKHLLADHPVHLVSAELFRIGLELGADVTYFLQNRAAWVSGIGETVSPVRNLPLAGNPVVLVLPHFELSTPAVYAKLRELQKNFSADPHTGQELGSRSQLLKLVENDLEQAASAIRPEIGELLTCYRGGEECVAGMTGSGSVLFLLSRSGGPLKLPSLPGVDCIHTVISVS